LIASYQLRGSGGHEQPEVIAWDLLGIVTSQPTDDRTMDEMPQPRAVRRSAGRRRRVQPVTTGTGQPVETMR
jgi:hypothetical protein